MSLINTTDGHKLHVEDTGSGTPIVFVHEFGGDQRSWEPQVRFFSRRYRCVTFNARGYTPSDVPLDIAAYSQKRAVDDIIDVMDGLKIAKAHIVGLSMGGFATLHLGLDHPDRALSLLVAGSGYGAEKRFEGHFKDVSLEVAKQFEALGAETFSHTYAMAAARIPYLVKDPRGWAEFRKLLGEHSAEGAALTMRGVQAERPSIYDLEDRLAKLKLPTLIMTGDEDDHCLQPALFLKKTIPASGLAVLPKTGHTLNLEEPAAFNSLMAEFLAQVGQDRWLPRDPRSDPAQIMRTQQ